MDRTAPRSSYATDYTSDAENDQSTSDEAKSKVNEAKSQANDAKDTAKQKAGQAKDQASEKATQAKAQAADKADTGLDQAASGMDKLADTIRDKAAGTSDEGAMGKVTDHAGVVADKLDQASGYLRDKDSDELINDLEALVRRKPMESVAVAVGVGFILSKAFR